MSESPRDDPRVTVVLFGSAYLVDLLTADRYDLMGMSGPRADHHMPFPTTVLAHTGTLHLPVIPPLTAQVTSEPTLSFMDIRDYTLTFERPWDWMGQAQTGTVYYRCTTPLETLLRWRKEWQSS